MHVVVDRSVRYGMRVFSGMGCPVGSGVRSATLDRMKTLIGIAHSRGFSRTGRDLSLADGCTYVVVPYLIEGSPELCWISRVVELSSPLTGAAPHRSTCRYARLDITFKDYRRLPRLRGRARSQFLHLMVWNARSPSAG
jgi:hypothetical protein